MLNIDSFAVEESLAQEYPTIPVIKVIEIDGSYGKFRIEPLERGYGDTLGNPIRRVLLNSIPGAAVTWVKIDGILHEYSTVPHVKEDVMELLRNIQKIRIKSVTGRPGKMRLDIIGEGMACAGDIATSADFEIVNPELHIATIDSPKGQLSIELNLDTGKGYEPASQREGLPIGVIPVDALFNPVHKANYSVTKTRVGQATDFECLVLEIWGDGTITPVEALKTASEILVNQLFLFSSPELLEGGSEAKAGAGKTIPIELYQTNIEKLELSPRTENALKRAELNKIGDVLELSDDQLIKIRNFGVKSLDELHEKLKATNLIPEEPKDAPPENKASNSNGTSEDSSEKA